MLLTVYALVSFKAFQPLLPRTPHVPPGEEFFSVPAGYSRRLLGDAMDKAAMGIMAGGSSSGGGYSGGGAAFYGGDPGEDELLGLGDYIGESER